MSGFLLFTIVFTTAYVGVEIFRRWSVRRNLLDIPNERSSHQTPTPRGGGIVIVLTTLSAYLILGLIGSVEFNIWFFAASVLIALISWLDDLFSVSFVWRFLVHSIAALLVIVNVGYFQVLEIPFAGTINLGIFGMLSTYLWIVWLTNAYNFMDGIDGIAGIQAVAAGLGWYFAGNLLGMPDAAIFGLLIAASGFGFLLHNWQPARVFMGDVGSAFIGFCFAAVPFLKNGVAENFGGLIPYLAILLVWLFVFDTIFTFLKRLLKKQKVWQAHREHLYQQIVIEGYSHKFVTILYGAAALLNSFIVVCMIYLGKISVGFILSMLLLESFLILIFVQRLKRSIKVLEATD